MDALPCTSMYFEHRNHHSDVQIDCANDISDCDESASDVESECHERDGSKHHKSRNDVFHLGKTAKAIQKTKRSKGQRQTKKRRKEIHTGMEKSPSEPHGEDTSEDSEYTPLQRQFHELKSKHPDVILLMETGYLYRLFGCDAEIARKELQFKTRFRHNLLTTSFPYQTLHIQIGRLAAKGYKVGVVRKTETALMKAAGEDKHCIFKRELVAVYTKSTLVGEEVDPVTTSYDNNQQIRSQIPSTAYLLSLFEVPGNHSSHEVRMGVMAVCSLSGDMIYDCFVDDDQRQALQSLLANVRPVEILIPETLLSDETERVITASSSGDISGEVVRIERMSDVYFKFDQSKVSLQEFFDSSKFCRDNMDNLMIYITGFPPPVICCIGAILAYLKEFKMEDVLTLIKNMKKYCPSHNCMYLDVDTMQALRLFRFGASSSDDGSLFGLIDKTLTAFGSRLLKTWLSQPLTNIINIQQRLDAIEEIRKLPSIISSAQILLSKMPDLESGITSIFYKKCSTKKYWKTISSLVHIHNFIESTRTGIQTLECKYLRDLFLAIKNSLQGIEFLRKNLDREAAWNGYKNRLFKDHRHYPNLLAATKDIKATQKKLDDLLPEIRLLLGKPNIQYSQFAEKEYVIIMKSSCALAIPSDWIIVAQTSKKICCRTAEMNSLAKKMKLLNEHFKYECHLAWLKYLEQFKPFYQQIRNGILNVAKLDCLISLATLSRLGNYTMPQLVAGSADACVRIEDGRHPVLHHNLESDKQYIPNDTFLAQTSTSCMIISGANMGGKSVYVQSVALTIILCQIGSFVPARFACISPLEAIYARSGVKDNIMRGKSSFCVEAGKVAEVFRNLPRKSLVLLDEFGRCTSDTDGIALAYGALRHLITKVSCLCLVVTQFMEIAKLGKELPGQVKNCHASTIVDNTCGIPEVIYLYKLVEGAGERGYSIKACSMAGIDESILAVAAAKSQEMEENNKRRRLAKKLFWKLCNGFGISLSEDVRQVQDLWSHFTNRYSDTT